MRTDTAKAVHLSDYRVPDYLIDRVELDVRLHRTQTRVSALLHVRPNPAGRAGAPLVLDGDEVKATAIKLDNSPLELPADDLTPSRLRIAAPPQRAFTLAIDTLVDPSANTQLAGLYRSGSAYCTQCEAEGFRRITYFLDRPDVLSVYTTRIEADRNEAPVLLGNGNLQTGGELEGRRHYAVWHDPWPKPCYLFALVGGNLDAVRDSFVTASGRNVALAIYVEPGKGDRALYAMDALKRSMRWDETEFGREYDLDVFNIVAVSDFNMGAMENKGLNIFNDKYVLASPQTATDTDYAHIESVIAHEYFHNWTGNRITCRDWFQLCLKEGLTVFRDQEFSADQRSRAVRRISDVRALRAAQFTEDAGPLAHNVRPQSYQAIDNFYTATVYQKGAEVIRMLRALIGRNAFSRGMTLYFDRYDGTAATVEQFVGCFADASGHDLSQFMRWYTQAGTPLVKARGSYDAAMRIYTLDLTQSCAPTPGQPEKLPQVIPVALGLIGTDGRDIALKLPAANEAGGASVDEIARGVFELKEAARRLVFRDVPSTPALSLMRGFSAPVRIETDQSEAQLLTLLGNDGDLFNRWQAVQSYATGLMLRSVKALRGGGQPADPSGFCEAMRCVLAGRHEDMEFTAQALLLPGELDLARDIGTDVDPDAIFAARESLRASLGRTLSAELAAIYEATTAAGPFSLSAADAGRRALRNAVLALIAAGDAARGAELAARQFEAADNMTDRIGALGTLCHIPGTERDRALAAFYDMFADDGLVIDKWFALQAAIPGAQALARVRALMAHPAFSIANPNRLRSVVSTFSAANPTGFNAADGSGYDFLADFAATLDARNPQVAARLLVAFKSWRALESRRREKARAALERIAAMSSLSADVRDIVTRSLA